MFKLFIVLMFSCSPVVVFAQPDTTVCNSFRRGHFTYTNDSGQLVHIRRKGRIQQETIPATGVVTRLRIKWPGDCAYEVTQLWSNSKALRKRNGSTTLVHITSTSMYSYQYSCSCSGSAAPTIKGIVNKVQRPS